MAYEHQGAGGGHGDGQSLMEDYQASPNAYQHADITDEDADAILVHDHDGIFDTHGGPGAGAGAGVGAGDEHYDYYADSPGVEHHIQGHDMSDMTYDELLHTNAGYTDHDPADGNDFELTDDLDRLAHDEALTQMERGELDATPGLHRRKRKGRRRGQRTAGHKSKAAQDKKREQEAADKEKRKKKKREKKAKKKAKLKKKGSRGSLDSKDTDAKAGDAKSGGGGGASSSSSSAPEVSSGDDFEETRLEPGIDLYYRFQAGTEPRERETMVTVPDGDDVSDAVPDSDEDFPLETRLARRKAAEDAKASQSGQSTGRRDSNTGAASAHRTVHHLKAMTRDQLIVKTDKFLLREDARRTLALNRALDKADMGLDVDIDEGAINRPLKSRARKLTTEHRARVEAQCAKARSRAEAAAAKKLDIGMAPKKRAAAIKTAGEKAVAKVLQRLPHDVEHNLQVQYGEGLEAGHEHKPWLPPSKYKANEFRKTTLYRGGRANVIFESLHSMQSMGPAVGSYLYFVQHLIIAFSLMSLVAWPMLSEFASGNGVILAGNERVDEIGWSQYTPGNARSVVETLNSAGDVVMVNTSFNIGSGDDIRLGVDLAAAVSSADLLVALVFLCYLVFMCCATSQTLSTMDADQVTSSRYSVLVRGLPRHATEHDVRLHFSDLYQLHGPDPEWRRSCGFWNKRVRRVKDPVTALPVDAKPGEEVNLDEDIQDEVEVYFGVPLAGGIRAGSGGQMYDAVTPMRPVLDVSNTQDASYLGSWVAEATMVYKNGAALRSYLRRLKRQRELVQARARVKKYSTDTPFWIGPLSTCRRCAVCCVRRWTWQVDKNQAASTGYNVEADSALVTFNNEESYRRCVSDYRSSTYSWGRMWQPQPLKFEEKYAIQVEPAAEPAQVRWEYLDTPPCSRFLRRMCTWLLIVLVLALWFSTVLYSNIKRKDFLVNKFPTDNVCYVHIPAALYGQYLNLEKPPITRDPFPGTCPMPYMNNFNYNTNVSVTAYPAADVVAAGIFTAKEAHLMKVLKPETPYNWINITCDQDQAGFVRDSAPRPANTAEEKARLAGLGITTEVKSLFTSPCEQPHPCNRPCIDVLNSTVDCPLPVCEQPLWEQFNPKIRCDDRLPKTYPLNTVFHCYCRQAMLLHAVEDNADAKGWLSTPFSSEPLCADWHLEFMFAEFMPYMVPLAAIFLNSFLRVMIQFMVRWFERHPSVDEEEYSAFQKTFVAQFFNTALLVTLVFTKLPDGAELPWLGDWGVLNQDYTGFSIMWYLIVSPQIMLSMLLMAVVPHLPTLALHGILWPLIRQLTRCCSASQLNMDILHIGPRFNTGAKYAFLLNIVFVTLMYCGTLPLLLPIAAATCVLLFIVDKIMLLKVYRKPKLINARIPNRMRELLPWALVLHCAVTVWMYGDDEVFDSPSADGWSTTSRDGSNLAVMYVLGRSNVWPIALLGAATLVSILAGIFFRPCLKGVAAWINRATYAATARVKARLTGAHRPEHQAAGADYTSTVGAGEASHASSTKARFEFWSSYKTHRHDVPPFTEVFERELPPESRAKVTARQGHDGWRVYETPGSTATFPRKVVGKVWKEDGAVFGIKHKKNQKQRTWEVIRDETGAESYGRELYQMLKDADLLKDAKSLSIPVRNISVPPHEADEAAGVPGFVDNGH